MDGQRKSWSVSAVILCVIAVLLVLFVAAHVLPAIVSRSNPPVMCQVFGGHWSIWNGWRCG